MSDMLLFPRNIRLLDTQKTQHEREDIIELFGSGQFFLYSRECKASAHKYLYHPSALAGYLALLNYMGRNVYGTDKRK